MKSPVFSQLIVCAGLTFSAFSHAAVTLADADSLWKFDGTGGTMANNQIIDSSANAHVVNNNQNLFWTTVPATGPYGGASVDPLARGLNFRPVLVTAVTGVGSSGGHVDNDVVNAAGFSASNATVTGSSTFVTRLKWDGALTGFDDNVGNYWMVNNGMGGKNLGSMMGITATGTLAYYTAALASGDAGYVAAATYTYNSSITLVKDVWYDIAMVVDDLGTINDGTGRVTFYAVPATTGALLTSISGNNLWVTNTSNSGLTVGSESLGAAGNSNQRKTLNGTMDYLAMFDTALTQNDVLGIFAVPEPSRGLLMLFGGMMLLSRRRR